MLNFKRNKHESGQIIVLLAIGIIALTAFLGLAIDGGRFLFLGKDVQNAADAAALAAAYEYCNGYTHDQAVEKGEAVAALNGFSNADGDVVVINNPASTAPETVNGNYYWEAWVTGNIQPYFIQVVYHEPISSTAATVYQCIRNQLALSRASIASIGTCDPNGLQLSGSQINADGTYSANDMFSSASSATFGTCSFNGDDNRNVNTTCGTTNTPTDEIYPEHLPPINLADYAPGGIKAVAAGDDYHYIEGDLLINPSNNDTLYGLYYIEGRLRITAPIGGKVTFISLKEIDISTDVATNIIPYVDNIFLYTPADLGCSKDVINLSVANGESSGWIYAPNGSCQINASSYTHTGAIVCFKVKVNASDSNFYFDDELYGQLLPIINNIGPVE